MSESRPGQMAFHASELVRLLKRFDPEMLEKFKQKPSISKNLDSGITLGEEGTNEPSLEAARDMASFAEQALLSAKKTCQEAIEIAMRKVRDSKRLRVIGQCLATIG